ncbi:hypothetical protein BTS2_1220 [Bacillus sp. TS-2]|nr:hypothetical protein BTS2_1220 [Bacillus sp. TS-2]
MRQRYVISLLIAGILLMYSIDYFSLASSGLELAFYISWLLFGGCVLLGNFIGLLYSNKKPVSIKEDAVKVNENKGFREYGR